MFEWFFNFVSIAWVAHSINTKHMLSNRWEKIEGMKAITPLEDILFQNLKASPGVFVHWGVYGSGKTTAGRFAGERLREEGRLVISLNGYNMMWENRRSLRKFVRQGIDIPEGLLQPISTFLTKPTTIVIDDLDILLRHSLDYRHYIKELMDESKETGRFNVLLMVTSWEWCQEMRDLGCVVLGSPTTWDNSHLTQLYESLPDSRRCRDRWKLLDVATIARTPGELIFSNSGQISIEHARAIETEWINGINALEGHENPVPSRFPGKDGIFHWDKVK